VRRQYSGGAGGAFLFYYLPLIFLPSIKMFNVKILEIFGMV
jgi:hypothetical protein